MKVRFPISSFVWYLAEDKEYYRMLNFSKLSSLFKEKDILLLPALTEKHLSEIEEGLERFLTFPEESPISVMSPFFPPKNLQQLFIVKRLPNKYGALTSQEYIFIEQAEDKEKAEIETIERKLRLKIHKPKLNLSMLRGSEKLKKEIGYIASTLNEPLLRARGVFLIGIPGTGKSYSAKCCAGELNRILIEMNLSQILQDDRPIDLLFRIFEYIEKLDYPSIMWIDEIDKVFTGGEKETKLMGQLLTILNEFNTETGYNADSFFWVTANSVQEIVMRNPEFFRRFDYLFFIQTPKKAEVAEIFYLYFKKYNVFPDFNESDLEKNTARLIRHIEMEYMSYIDEASVISSERFIYTPAEIERIVKKLAVISFSRLLKESSKNPGENKKMYFTSNDVSEVIKLNRPVIVSMKESINAMISQKKSFIEV